MTATTSNHRSLFIASCASLLVTSLSFGIRAGILNDLGVEFELNGSELSRIAATAFWGFPVSMIIGGALVDKVGMKNLMRLAYIGHFAGIHSPSSRAASGPFGSAPCSSVWPMVWSRPYVTP